MAADSAVRSCTDFTRWGNLGLRQSRCPATLDPTFTKFHVVPGSKALLASGVRRVQAVFQPCFGCLLFLHCHSSPGLLWVLQHACGQQRGVPGYAAVAKERTHNRALRSTCEHHQRQFYRAQLEHRQYDFGEHTRTGLIPSHGIGEREPECDDDLHSNGFRSRGYGPINDCGHSYRCHPASAATGGRSLQQSRVPTARRKPYVLGRDWQRGHAVSEQPGVEVRFGGAVLR